MNDENVQETSGEQNPTNQNSAWADRAPDSPPVQLSPPSAAHPVDEDPEEHIGEQVKDPWTDEQANDWPKTEVAAEEPSVETDKDEDE